MDASEALVALSFARTALDDPGGLPNEEMRKAAGNTLKAYAIDKIDDAMRALGVDIESRTILVHFNVTVPGVDARDADEIAEVMASAMEVGSDDPSLAGLTYSIVLAEEV